MGDAGNLESDAEANARDGQEKRGANPPGSRHLWIAVADPLHPQQTVDSPTNA
jgi:hypothetical protein